MSKKRRVSFVALAVIAFVLVYSAGAESSISLDEAQDLKDTFLEQTEGIDAIGIFLNNFRIAAMTFIPALGVAMGLFAAYSTGLIFKALAETTPQVAELPPLIILATPFGAMELISYGIAMSQSVILITAIFRKVHLKPVAVATMIQLGIVCVLLLAGAFIEMYMIESVSEEGVFTGST
ncbi:MAG: stage II sporulation protein M [Nitrososphaerales archaeon]